jgi:hypothetical protein
MQECRISLAVDLPAIKGTNARLKLKAEKQMESGEVVSPSERWIINEAHLAATTQLLQWKYVSLEPS